MTDKPRMEEVFVDNPSQAVDKARALFAANPDLGYVLADGRATLGGVLYFAQGPLLLSRQEKGIYLGGHSVAEGVALMESGATGWPKEPAPPAPKGDPHEGCRFWLGLFGSNARTALVCEECRARA